MRFFGFYFECGASSICCEYDSPFRFLMTSLKLGLLSAAIALGTSAYAAPSPMAAATSAIPATTTLQVSTLDHVGMNVPDIDAAVTFFSDLFGARIVSDMHPEGIPAAWKTQFRWHPTSDLKRFVMVQLTGGPKVELFQYEGPDIDRSHPHGDDIGASHIALRTDNIARSLSIVKAKGLKVLNEPITNADGVQWFYFLTPWGAQIELVSFTNPSHSRTRTQ
ncbi:catechol 2,3-dioxygenase-like lactoylglutathione lyase family enzyme [Cupriavidus plantarum]|uniref:Catechol 2,3-dioxygenase-like lactoylglutathione lyase family enzyme n=2 Tax=Cupriavidus plantarum TaxID=942865 RepID=A0A316ENE6_9BURK|nr:catechol 2,3-dioxygenase-like lactoylglutathione lyase family enzyme [Cupriavidus plantarum]